MTITLPKLFQTDIPQACNAILEPFERELELRAKRKNDQGDFEELKITKKVEDRIKDLSLYTYSQFGEKAKISSRSKLLGRLYYCIKGMIKTIDALSKSAVCFIENSQNYTQLPKETPETFTGNEFFKGFQSNIKELIKEPKRLLPALILVFQKSFQALKDDARGISDKVLNKFIDELEGPINSLTDNHAKLIKMLDLGPIRKSLGQSLARVIYDPEVLKKYSDFQAIIDQKIMTPSWHLYLGRALEGVSQVIKETEADSFEFDSGGDSNAIGTIDPEEEAHATRCKKLQEQVLVDLNAEEKYVAKSYKKFQSDLDSAKVDFNNFDFGFLSEPFESAK